MKAGKSQREEIYLEMLSVLQLRLILLFEVLGSLSLGRIELAEVSFIVIKPLTVLMDNVLSDIVKERPVVRSDVHEL